MKTKTVAEWYAIWLSENQTRFNEEHPIGEFYSSGPSFERMLKEKQDFNQASLFWEFVRTNRDALFLKRDLFIEFLTESSENKNRLVRAVALMELLPTPIWRKVLWRENIDFISYESFLRRITDEQIEAMARNLSDIREGKYPEVGKKSSINDMLFNRKMEVFPLTEGNTSKRYTSRAAWAYNLLGLDFGFSLYPKGPDDDTQITNKKFTRFLSVKEHINDFVVNQEDGKYWWLYKTARSNYVWFPNRHVELKTHVCPGFWATLILHLMFWIVSPLCFSAAITSWISSGAFWNWWSVATLVTALTPLWLLIAFLRMTLPGVARFFGKIFSYKKFWEIFGVVFSLLVVLLFMISFIVVIWRKWGIIVHDIIQYYDFCGNVLHLGVFISTIAPFIIIINFYRAVDCIFSDTTWRKNFLDKPLWFKALSILIGFQIIDSTISPVIVEGIRNVVSFAIEETIMFIEIAGSLIFIAYLVYVLLQTDFAAREEEYARNSTKIRSVILYWIGGQIILLVVNGGVSLDDFNQPLMALFILFSILLAGIFWLMTEKINEETIPLREEATSRIEFFKNRFDWSDGKGKNDYDKLSKRLKSLLLKNNWLMSLPHDVFRQKFDVFIKSFDSVYDPSSVRVSMEILLPILDEKLFRRITILNRQSFRPYGSDYIPWLKLVLAGVSGKRAMTIIEENHRKKVIADRNTDKLLTSIGNFFKCCYGYTLKPIVSFFVWCGRTVLTLRDLWKLFNERCPYISKEKYLG